MINISDHGITYAMSGPFDGPVYKKVLLRYMDIQVRDSGGNLVAETEYGKTIHGRSIQPPAPKTYDPDSRPKNGPGGPRGGALGIYLAPGRGISEESDLNKEFDLSKPGTYTVQAFGYDLATGKTTSNKITFTITP